MEKPTTNESQAVTWPQVADRVLQRSIFAGVLVLVLFGYFELEKRNIKNKQELFQTILECNANETRR